MYRDIWDGKVLQQEEDDRFALGFPSSLFPSRSSLVTVGSATRMRSVWAGAPIGLESPPYLTSNSLAYNVPSPPHSTLNKVSAETTHSNLRGEHDIHFARSLLTSITPTLLGPSFSSVDTVLA